MNKQFDPRLDQKIAKLAKRCEQRSNNAVFRTTAQDFKQNFFKQAIGMHPVQSRSALVLKIAAMAAVCLISLHIIMTMANFDMTKNTEAAVMNKQNMAIQASESNDLSDADTAVMKGGVSKPAAPATDTMVLAIKHENFPVRPAMAEEFSKEAAPVQQERTVNLIESKMAKPSVRMDFAQKKKASLESDAAKFATGGNSANQAVMRFAQNAPDTVAAEIPAVSDAPAFETETASGVMASKTADIPEKRIIHPPYHPIVWPQPLSPIRIVPAQPENLQPVQVERGHANVKVIGDLAITTYEFLVANPNGRALEGQFEMPLPENASITGTALDINGDMVEASIVPKERAREVFEIIERQGADPALVESVGGNTYRTRIYPVPANGTRRIRLQFVTKVTEIDNTPVLILPMRFENKLKEFALRIEVTDEKADPRVETSQFANLTFNNWHNVILAEQTITDAALPEDLRLALAKSDKQEIHLEKSGNDLWFHLNRQAPSGGKRAVVDISAINLIWDASGSR